MFVYLRAKFQVSSVILTGFRQGVIVLHTAKQTLKKPAHIRLNHDNFSSFKTSSKHLQGVLKDGELYILETRNFYAEGDFKTSWRPNNVCWVVVKC